METLLIVLLIVVLLVRWAWLRDRISQLEGRMDALQKQIAFNREHPVAPRVTTAAAPAQPIVVPPQPQSAVAPPPPQPSRDQGAPREGAVAPPAVAPPPLQPPPQPIVPPPQPLAAPLQPPPSGPQPLPEPVVPPPPFAAPPPLQPAPQPSWAQGAPQAASREGPVAPPQAPRAGESSAPPAPPAPPALPALPAPPLHPPDFLLPQPPRPRVVPVAARTSADWEALVGGNWLNKMGVFILVIGIALALGYSFTRMNPAGRVALAVTASLAMLAAGAVFENRERYRTFARGLLGGGWATLYFTVYAAQAVDAAKVIDSPAAGALLLLAVGVGMVLHSLRYRSETVTGIAYFLSFVTLGITQVTALSVIALVPLAASLLYLAHRFGWFKMALLGLVATYVTCGLQHDTGAPLWQTQAVFAVYWLLFEGFDILHPAPALLPLNAIGFLTLSVFKWHLAAPGREWMILSATGVAYLTSTIIRARRSEWRVSITLTGALAAAAIFLELDHQWIALALLIEAELYYVAGLIFGSEYLRGLAAAAFSLQAGQMFIADVGNLPYRAWTPIAALDAVVFYANRALRPADILYGYAASVMVALVAGFEAQRDRGLAWFALAAGPFLVGWSRRLSDFRFQAYGLGLLGLIGMAAASPEPRVSLAIAAVLAYGAVLSALRSAPDRFADGEAEALRLAASLAVTGLLASLAWQLAPAAYRGLAWMGLALALLELGLRNLPRELRWQSYALAAMGAFLVGQLNVLPIVNSGPLEPRLIPAWTALAAYAMAWRARREEGEKVLTAASFVGNFFLMVALWALLPAYAVGPAWAGLALILAEIGLPVLRLEAALVTGAAVGRLAMANLTIPERLLTVTPVLVSHYYLWWRTHWRFYLYTAAALGAALIGYQAAQLQMAPAWALFALALLAAGRQWQIPDLCWQSYALSAMAFAACSWFDLPSDAALPPAAVVVACLYAAQLVAPRSSLPRLGYSLAAAVLLAALLYYRVSGSVLTVAWGLEGIALLTAGFPLTDRNQRLSGLALLMFCILKLFFYDLRHLETLPRILSFIVLGLILVAVSWIYTRFRERVQRYL